MLLIILTIGALLRIVTIMKYISLLSAKKLHSKYQEIFFVPNYITVTLDNDLTSSRSQDI